MEQIQEPSQARQDAAVAVRRLVHGLVGNHGTEADLAELARVASELADRLEASERRMRPASQVARHTEPVDDGGHLGCWPDCMVAGEAHPYGTGLHGYRDGDEAVVEVVLGRAHEGPPGRAHGGMVAALFDEAMGFATSMKAIPTYTAWLRVDYRAPMPLAKPIELRARMTDQEGRKAFVAATATCEGQLLAEAEGLFVIPREHLAPD
ncbi:MAG: PaaI family thioesterase [Actinomycetia bacterium]|nr:PaaI family thioesterase [Actinomycetes bacterium]